MQNKMDTSLSGELPLLLPLRRRREDPCVECLNVLKKLQVCFPEFTKIEFLQIIFTMYSHQKASLKRSRNFILNIPYVLIFLSSYHLHEDLFCRRPFEGCFWKHTFSTGQKQIHLSKSSTLWTVIFLIIPRGVFRTQSKIYYGAFFCKSS